MTPKKKYFLFIGNEKKAFGTLLAAKSFCCKYTKNERVKYLTGSYILSCRGGIAIAVTSIIVTTDGIIAFEKNKEFKTYDYEN
jgi:hypothetical protein